MSDRERRKVEKNIHTYIFISDCLQYIIELKSLDGNDSDDLIIQAFKAYDVEGLIDVKMFQHALKTWGDKMTMAEIDDIFGEFDIDEDYMVKTKEVLGLFVAQKEEEKKVKFALSNSCNVGSTNCRFFPKD